MKSVYWYCVALLILVAAFGSPVFAQSGEAIMPTRRIDLFDGKTLAGWTFVSQDTNRPAASIWSVTNGVIRCLGKPNGYARTARAYRDYRLHVEWRWPDGPGNSGVFVQVNPPDLVWPLCFEAQLLAGDAGELRLNGGARLASVTDPKVNSLPRRRPSSERPAGEWNVYDIVCRGDTIAIRVNGVLQNEAAGTCVDSGAIGLQAEGKLVEFRNIYIEPIETGLTNDTLARAMAAMQAAVPRAEADPARPIFHVRSPAQWMNDPNGPIYYRGYYHLFYQLTPFSEESGVKYWGHVRSRDLVKWEPLPIAIGPSTELGEASIWSGCCTINGDGKPMIFYTSIGEGKSAFDQAEQWAAIGDNDLLTWQKSLANPVLSEAVNRGTKIYDWRDPFVFHDGRKTFLVAGGHLARNGDAAVNIYEAKNASLTQWDYRGVLFHLPDAPTVECPNFFKLGNQWVLFVSPYGKVEYLVGDFDDRTCRFQPHTHGLLDYGSNFYAPNTMQVPDGRRLVWGWINGFPRDHGWNGCLSLPRLLSLSRDGQLQQKPAPQLSKLRGEAVEWRHAQFENGSETFALPKTNTLEIAAEIRLEEANRLELQIKSGDSDSSPIVVNFDGSELQVMDVKAPLELKPGKQDLNLRIFIDRSVLEVFANETVCVTKVISPLEADATLKIQAAGGTADVRRVRAWPMKTIW